MRAALLLVTGLLATGLRGSAAAGPLLDLPVPGFGDAVVAPATADGPQPVLIALHGSFDRPDWHCETWGGLLGGRLTVLCPRGTLRWDTPQEAALRRYYYRGGDAMPREIDAALAALAARLPGRVDPGSLLYLGFSQGAIYGVPLLQRRPARFPLAVLVEGGTAWTRDGARRYAAGGGRRVLFACGQAGCRARAQAAAATLEAAGVGARVVFAPGVGHSYDGAVAARIAEAMDWLAAGRAAPAPVRAGAPR